MVVSRSFPASVFAAAVVLAALVAPVSAQDRCEGTLCDLYYEHMAKPTPAPSRPAAQQASPQAAPAGDGVLSRLFGGGTQPPADGAPPPAKKPLVAVQGGGVVGLMQGRAPARCTGTLCDFYYGGPPPEEPVAAGPAAAPAPAARAAEAEADELPVAGSREAGSGGAGRGIEPRESVRRCAASPRDPWACYR